KQAYIIIKPEDVYYSGDTWISNNPSHQNLAGEYEKLPLEPSQFHISTQTSYGSIELKKQVKQHDSTISTSYQGINFALYQDSACLNMIPNTLKETNDQGIITWDNLLPQTYYYQEADTIIPQIIVNKTCYEIKVEARQTSLINEGNPIINEVKGYFILLKHHNDNPFKEEKPLSNSKWGLYEDNKLLNLITYYMSDENGLVTSDYLKAGVYYLKEEATNNPKLALDDQIYEVVINNNQITYLNQGLPIINKVINNKINIIKRDYLTKEILSGAIINIYNENDLLIMSITTSNEPTIINLDYGKYYLKEVVAPNGYILSNEIYPIDINQDQQVIEVEILNKQEPIIKSGTTLSLNIIIINIIIATILLKKGGKRQC
ncbi:MAG: MSCRAMM family protein, partial [Bacilli bacterium]